MAETIVSLWMYEARVFPMVLGLSIFSGLHLLRRITKMAYTPSYFAIFPLSMLDGQLSDYFEEFYTGVYVSVKEGRKKNPKLFLKAWISFFMTFLMVPLLSGFTVAFILSRHEFTGYLVLLLGFEGWHCFTAVLTFGRYREEWRSVLKFFVPFYGTYLFFLWLVIRQSYHFTIPFTENSDYSNLASALETTLGPVLVGIVALGVVTNLLAHWLVNKDALEPNTISDSDSDYE
jgi:hypothetical protein